MGTKSQYPPDWSAPNHGKCEKCNYPTMAHDPRWLVLCPQHWQELTKRPAWRAEKGE